MVDVGAFWRGRHPVVYLWRAAGIVADNARQRANGCSSSGLVGAESSTVAANPGDEGLTRWEARRIDLVDGVGFEPTTPTMRTWCSPN